jgi:hypothetical protein
MPPFKGASVDEFVRSRVLPELRPIVARLRRLMKRYAPAVRETISYGIPAYRAHRIIAVISPTKKDITLAFSRGAAFDDKYHLLQGVGKTSKNLKLRTTADVNETVLRYYLKQAIKLDSD